MEVPLNGTTESGNSEQSTSVEAAKDRLVESNTIEPELIGEEKKTLSETFQKDPCEDEVLDCNNLDDLNTAKGNSGLHVPAKTLARRSTNLLESDVISGKDDGEGNVAESKVDNKKTTIKAAEHQSPEDDHGPGARPNEKTFKTEDPTETTKEKAMEMNDKVAETNPHCSSSAANKSEANEMLLPETENSKQPTEIADSSPSSPVESNCPCGSDSELYSDSDENTGSLKEEPINMLSPHGSMQEANGSTELSECLVDNTENIDAPPDVTAVSGNCQQATSVKAAQDHLVESNTTEPEFAGVEKTTFSKTFQKEPCKDEVPDCKNLKDLNTRKDNTGVPTTTLPSMSSNLPDSNVVPDSKEDDKENVAESKVDDEKTTSKGAEHQSPEDDHGPGARRKEKTFKTEDPAETTKEKAIEQDHKVAETNPHGTSAANNPEDNKMPFPETENSKQPTVSTDSNTSSPIGSIHPCGSESALNCDDDKGTGAFKESQIAETNVHGTFPLNNSGDYEMPFPETENSKTEPTGSKASKPSSPVESIHQSGSEFELYSDEERSGPVQGSSSSTGSPECHLPSGALSPPPSDHGGSTYSGHPVITISGLPHAELIQVASAVGQMPDKSELNQQQQQALMKQLVSALQECVGRGESAPSTDPVPQPHSGSHNTSTTDSPLQPKAYSKGGYSVVVSNGELCESTGEKGVVMMESGTEFFIAIGNDNDHAAEVDIAFGGMYLGVWMLEAKQSLSSPVIIEGSSWAEGRLRFFSALDENRPEPNADFYGKTPELNGLIELEFKPEVDTLTMFAHHVREQGRGLVPISIAMTDSETATVGDLKREIRRKWHSNISCLLNGGKVLQEEKTISSYALNKDEVIQVVNAEEELKIESSGKETVSMKVDPRMVSVEAVKDFIAEKMKIPSDQQLLRFKEKVDNVDSKSLTHMLFTSKKTPVLMVYTEKLEERNTCDSSAKLTHDETADEINGQGNGEMIDSGLINMSKVNVSQPESTHRGFITSVFTGGSHTKGFEGLPGLDDDISATSNQGFPSGTRAGNSCTENVGNDDSEDNDKEGIAMLCGNEESVYKQFQEDDIERKFSKEAVTLLIQLKTKSTDAEAGTASSQPSAPSGANSSGPTGPKSTPYPPPVPE